jgi:bifunctional DNA-binding transcriptional regulator/antitoxin component of YhaV-PrlF toxin-antitoxin module
VIEARAVRKTGKAMKKYKFKAKIEAGDGGGAHVLFPNDTGKEFATKGKVACKGDLDGVPYTGSLFKYGNPLHLLGMPKAIREQIGKSPGDTLEVVVWKDEEVRTVEVPAQFENLMKKEGLLPVFKKLSYTHRKEYCRWITEAKKEETRVKRSEKAIEMLKQGVSTPG